MPGSPPPSRPTGGETTALVIQVVDELARRLTQDGTRPPAEPDDTGDESRRRALLRLRVLVHVKQAVRSLEDQAARSAAASGAGYPEIGRAVGMSRQGARRRWPGLITNGAHPHTHRPTHRSP
ncbi:hypothetical protein ACL02U_04030 [Streptomyces sp. MS06]|uniref:hypothetical protein n=1 Tax=Streptomyces sp. MS06 TaxID=3385974 RepID=UPI0039A14456